MMDDPRIQYIDQLEEAYQKDVSELNAEIARLRRENEKLREQLSISDEKAEGAEQQLRHI